MMRHSSLVSLRSPPRERISPRYYLRTNTILELDEFHSSGLIGEFHGRSIGQTMSASAICLDGDIVLSRCHIALHGVHC